MSSGKKSSGKLAMRGWLRVGGPALVLVGLVFLAVSSIDFFSGKQSATVQFRNEQKAARTTQSPEYRWARWVGVPLVMVGIVLTSIGFDRLFASAKQEDDADENAPRRTMDQPLGQWSTQRTGKRGSNKGNRKG